MPQPCVVQLMASKPQPSPLPCQLQEWLSGCQDLGSQRCRWSDTRAVPDAVKHELSCLTTHAVPTQIGKTKYPRMSAGSAVAGGCLYLAGGHNLDMYHDTMERYDPRAGRWKLVRTTPRHPLPPPTNHSTRSLHACPGSRRQRAAMQVWSKGSGYSMPERGCGMCGLQGLDEHQGGHGGACTHGQEASLVRTCPQHAYPDPTGRQLEGGSLQPRSCPRMTLALNKCPE